MTRQLVRNCPAIAALLGASIVALAGPARAQDPLLQEAVEFAGALQFLVSGAPGYVLAAVRDGETAVAGYGEIADGSGTPPDGDTIMRIGSISKVFCGLTLASLLADGTLALTDPAQDHLTDLTVPEKDGTPLRIIDLATQSSGLPRELPRAPAPPDQPFANNTKEAQATALEGDPFIFTPGTGFIYSNWGFDLLGATLAGAGGKPYSDLLRERVLDPFGMADTWFNPPADDADFADRLMQGHGFDGAAMPVVTTPETVECAGGLYTTANDMLTWLGWHLDSSGGEREMRAIDHAAWRYRDGHDPVLSMDEAGRMDAMGLGWVVMLPEGDRPLILQKAGGIQGMFVYVAMAPTRGVGVFSAMNTFNLGGATAMMEAVNDLIAQLAPR